jgi:hypothetical protein
LDSKLNGSSFVTEPIINLTVLSERPGFRVTCNSIKDSVTTPPTLRKTLATTIGRRTRHNVRSTHNLPETTPRMTYRPHILYTPYSHYPTYSAKTKLNTPSAVTALMQTCATFVPIISTTSTPTIPLTTTPILSTAPQMEVEFSTTVLSNSTDQFISTLRTVVVTEPYVDVPLVVTLGEWVIIIIKKI